MIQTHEDFIEAYTRAEGLTIPFGYVYAILEKDGDNEEIEEHSLRLLNNSYERYSYEDRLQYTLNLLSKDKWLLYLDKYGNIFSGIVM